MSLQPEPQQQPAQPVPAPVPPPAPQFVVNVPQPVQPDRYSVGIAYILLILLGAIGAHRFYIGKVGTGLLYLFTLGLLGVGLIFDLFTLGSQVRAQNALARR